MRELRPGSSDYRADYPDFVAAAVSRFLTAHLATEHPDFFRAVTNADGTTTFDCHLTGESLLFASDGTLLSPAFYADAFDALCCQVPEDMAVVRQTVSGDHLAALHICTPSHWAPEEKIGKNFEATHAPVPHMGKVRAAGPGLVAAMIARPPTVRFTWGIEWDDRLDLHPTPKTSNGNGDRKRGFGPGTIMGQPLFLRVERQVIWGLPSTEAALFTIRVYCYDLRPLRADATRREALINALGSMSP